MDDKTLEEIRNLAAGILNDRAELDNLTKMISNLAGAPENGVKITVGDRSAVITREAHALLRNVLSDSSTVMRMSMAQKEKQLRDIFDECYCKKCEEAWNDPDV